MNGKELPQVKTHRLSPVPSAPALPINSNSAPVCSASEESVKPLRQGGTRSFHIAAGLGIIAAEWGIRANEPA
jgi:hypothetical protein